MTLTPRQREMLCLALYDNAEIVKLLDISPRTLTQHWTQIYRKLLGPGDGRKRRLKAVVRALQLGWIQAGELRFPKRRVK